MSQQPKPLNPGLVTRPGKGEASTVVHLAPPAPAPLAEQRAIVQSDEPAIERPAVNLSVRVETDVYEELRSMAFMTRRTQQDLLREAVEDKLAKWRAGRKDA